MLLYDRNLAQFVVGQASLGAIAGQALFTFFGDSELKVKQQGQRGMFDRVHNFLLELLGDKVTVQTNLVNYFHKHGKLDRGLNQFTTIPEEMEQEIQQLANAYVVECYSVA